MVLVVIWLMVALVIGLYVLFVVWRLRAERRRKAMDQNPDSTWSSTIARAATITPPVVPPTTAPTSPTAPTTSTAPATTVAEALSGISMPHDLVPLTTIAPRPGVVDQVAFSSKLSVDVVGPAFADELERLGYAVTPLDERSLAATRGDDALVVYIHPAAPGTAQEGTVVIEVCVPF